MSPQNILNPVLYYTDTCRMLLFFFEVNLGPNKFKANLFGPNSISSHWQKSQLCYDW